MLQEGAKYNELPNFGPDRTGLSVSGQNIHFAERNILLSKRKSRLDRTGWKIAVRISTLL